jgi:S1-C subfamily serine protease
VNVGNDPVGAQEMVSKSGQRGVPVIVVDEQVIVGFDQVRLEQLLTAAPRHISLGVSVADATKFSTRGAGAYVGHVRSGSAADQAGLRMADVITQFAGRAVTDAAELEQLLAGLAPGARVALEWQRGDEAMQGEARL